MTWRGGRVPGKPLVLSAVTGEKGARMADRRRVAASDEVAARSSLGVCAAQSVALDASA